MSASGWVYFLEAGGLVKIGYSAKPDRRIAELRTMNGASVTEIGRIPGDRALEQELHSRYAEFRRHGEWFELPERWRNEVIGSPTDAIDADDQVDYVARLRVELSEYGVDDDLTVAMLLDALACAGLRLAEDDRGVATAAYFVHAGFGLVT